MSQDKKVCYVITPYGIKDIGGGVEVNFEDVYVNIVTKGVNLVRGHQLDLRRSKDEKKAGGITEEFINSILNAEVAIIDVSSGDSHGNANVFYELGLRHAFRKRASVIIAVQETQDHLPFDIKDMRVIFYDRKTLEGQEQAAREIAEYIEAALSSNRIDSPVFKLVPGYEVTIPPKKFNKNWTYEYQVKGCANKRIGVKTGDLPEIVNIDVWVNSENNAMEMGRMCDHSVSGLIRYYGAIRDVKQWVKKDIIQDYLRKQLGDDKTVAPAAVIVTESGGLQSRGVKKLLHVAVFLGEHGKGYRPVSELGKCITNALEKLQELNSPRRGKGGAGKAGVEPPVLMSVLFPIFGIRTVGLDPDDVMDQLITAACNYAKNHPESVANRIYFQAYSEDEVRLSNHMMQIHRELEALPAEALREGVTSNLGIGSSKDLVTMLGELKSAANALRKIGDLKGAIERLRTGMVEGMDALASGNKDVALASEIADCFGMLGGNLIRVGSVSEALAVYKAGRDIEMGMDGVTMTYNTVNLLVTGLLDAGWDSLQGSGPDIEKVVERLDARIKSDGHGDIWTWADLGMCEFLQERFREAEAAYSRAAMLGDDTSRSSMRDKLFEIRDRWPQDSAERRSFYERIQRILN